MEKNRWLDFLSGNLQSQIQLEWSRKLQTWALFLVGFISFGIAVSAVGDTTSKVFLFTNKILFLFFFHTLMIFGFYFPLVTQKGEGAASRMFGIRDFMSLTTVHLFLMATFVVIATLSWQVLGTLKAVDMSGFFTATSWLNFSLSAFYVAAGLFFSLSYFFFPGALVKVTEKARKITTAILILHALSAVFTALGYMEVVKIGTVTFFEQVRIAGLFWFFLLSVTFGMGKMLHGSSVAALSSLQLEVASGKLERGEDILQRFQDAFILRRLAFWIKRISHKAATLAHEIAQHTHDAVAIAEKDTPNELDLRQVEERYKKADGLYKKLDRENARFLLAITLYDLSEAEREKVEAVRDVFSKELRNAKLELASVRKRIDEKLVAIKNIERPQLTTQPKPKAVPAEEVTVEEELPLNETK